MSSSTAECTAVRVRLRGRSCPGCARLKAGLRIVRWATIVTCLPGNFFSSSRIRRDCSFWNFLCWRKGTNTIRAVWGHTTGQQHAEQGNVSTRRTVSAPSCASVHLPAWCAPSPADLAAGSLNLLGRQEIQIAQLGGDLLATQRANNTRARRQAASRGACSTLR